MQSKYDIFVHQLEEGTWKISNTAEVIHNVDKSANLSKIIELLMNIDNDEILYIPKKTIYWLRKGNKQPVLLKTDKDLATCKKEYGTGSIRIACSVVYASNSSSGTCLIDFFNIFQALCRHCFGCCIFFLQRIMHLRLLSLGQNCWKNMRTSNLHT